jgi:hypothetical protein
LSPLWEWKHRRTPAAEVRKILFEEKRRERLHGGEYRGTGNLWSHGSGWGLGFTAFLCIAWGRRCLSDADGWFLGRRSVFLTSCGQSFKSPLSVTTLTAVRNRDDEDYLVTASCLRGWWRGPQQHQGWPREGLLKRPR